ncbi:phenylalanine 4-monooxygenase [Wenzhouxiangella sp. XN201]|uniref:phenylalanine 4-monooxygenase n=1 Tax=Wenzhouxiangella sp. XN201 TaxID=2710755 RepID=UPI0013C9AC5B|nr:phenylalanine 4-monooxygenase [Wenzhouxiangella sp. XN201]NEZ03503.1 phenylalanine 4-monooxygenase [Wenzhouxiangella sp. XN201]
MGKSTKYEAKVPDENGIIPYTDEEHSVWRDLYARQIEVIQGRVCQEFLDGLEILDLPTERIPQPGEVSKVLRERTGWEVAPVPALINFDRFFKLLSERKFPAASFIRSREEMDYLQEPDIFHEIFGHTTMLTHQAFADFTEAYGKAGVMASKKERVFLARLYWFTVEFGLIDTAKGMRIYGGGIASSPGETVYSLESDKPMRRPFDPIDALRTPYRIDIFQTVYYVLDQMDDLFDLAGEDLLALIRKARALGQFEPTYPPKTKEAA